MTSATRQLSWTDFFTVAVRPRTYGNLLYLWLGFPLGLAYFVGLTVGISTGVPLSHPLDRPGDPARHLSAPPGAPPGSSGSWRSICSAPTCRSG